MPMKAFFRFLSLNHMFVVFMYPLHNSSHFLHTVYYTILLQMTTSRLPSFRATVCIIYDQIPLLQEGKLFWQHSCVRMLHNCPARHCVSYMHMNAHMHAHKLWQPVPSVLSLANLCIPALTPCTPPPRHVHVLMSRTVCGRLEEERSYSVWAWWGFISSTPWVVKNQECWP